MNELQDAFEELALLLPEFKRKNLEAAASLLLPAFLNLSRELLIVLTGEGIISLVSTSWQEYLGWSRSDMTGKNISDFIHPRDLNRTFKVLNFIVEGEEIENLFYNRYRTKKGEYIWIEWPAEKETSYSKSGFAVGAGRIVTNKLVLEKLNNQTD